MKKILICTLCFFIILIGGCGQQSNNSKSNSKSKEIVAKNIISPNSPSKIEDREKVVEIKDKMFIQQCEDIYLNPNDYKDKIINLEGMYQKYTNEGETYHVIYRKSPGCCGNDGEVGFQFNYNGKMPNLNDWIKASGTIEVVKDSNGNENIILNLKKLEVSDKRGVEFVNY